LFCIAAVAALAVGVSWPALAIECPAAQPLTRPGILRETPRQIVGMSNQLAAGDLAGRLPLIVSDLQSRYPGVEGAEVINYLTTAYCPVVASIPDLDEAEQQARMDQFVRLLVQIIY
jgi:hypothetical protein